MGSGSRSGARGQVFQRGLFHYAVNVQQRDDAVLDVGHAKEVLGGDFHSEIRCPLNFVLQEIEHLVYAVHDESHVKDPAGWKADLDDDNAGGVRGFRGSEAKADVEIHHRNQFSAKIDDALETGGRLRNGCDVHQPDDFADLENRQPIGLLSQAEGEIL